MESPIAWRIGWLHGTPIRTGGPRVFTIEDKPDFGYWDGLAREFRARLHERSEIRLELAERLGVSVPSLDALDVGLCATGTSWPMFDHLRRAIGIRVRRWDDEKRSIRGSRSGLFLPLIEEQPLVLLCEGGSDCAAAITLGFFAIGRPDCSGGVSMLVRWIERRANCGVAIMADDDGPGRAGALVLAETLAPFARSVRVVLAPCGAKDLREALRRGASRQDVLDAIADSPRIVPAIRWEDAR